MAIEYIEQWWYGSEASDIGAYLQALTTLEHPVDEVRPVVCACGSSLFQLNYNADAGGAQRVCILCRHEQFIANTTDFWDAEKVTRLVCSICQSQEFNLAIGFALFKNRAGIHWLYVGERCSWCHVLGSCPAWEISVTPSLHLLEKI